MLNRPPDARPRPGAISIWLLLVAAMVLAMIAVGGITRLTESGLSIVRWEPVSGILPPLGEEQWQAEFDAYRNSPQYQQINRGMSLAEFKHIYFWEYVHRLLGRLIGLAFALPLLWFWWRRAIPKGQGRKLAGLLALGGLQGAIGWWMVASGLVDRPEVSHIRLAVHLLAAFAIFGLLIWVALDHRELARARPRPPARMPTLAIWALSTLFLQFLFGAYVAGLEAGYAFNTWPRMGDEWFPSETPMMSPFLANFVDNPIVVQFVHRWLAMIVAALALALAAKAWLGGQRAASAALAAAVFLQVQLGILTILSGVEIGIAVAHQAMAAVLLGAVLFAAHRLRARRREIEP
ncbi:COX15/CtaA family protein [Allosphingosinicella sp.]|jgi:cytochrome c oxidase assembly protein subunit 15|uniref:COX15/CtaA family protein n=1 Tax=Allosphingosinicella sp. TaxID=2823234 RepID=UPI002EEB0ED0